MQLGLRPGRAGLGCKDPGSEARGRHRQTHLQVHTHTYSGSTGGQDLGTWGQSPQGLSFRSAGPKGQVWSNLPPLSDNTQSGVSSSQALASKKVCIMGISLLQIQLSSASSRKPSLTISPNWSISCLPSCKPDQGTLR